jgi:hypothetical protein
MLTIVARDVLHFSSLYKGHFIATLEKQFAQDKRNASLVIPVHLNFRLLYTSQ